MTTLKEEIINGHTHVFPVDDVTVWPLVTPQAVIIDILDEGSIPEIAPPASKPQVGQ